MRKISFYIMLLFVVSVLVACGNPVYQHTIEGVNISENPIKVNQPVTIGLKLSDIRKDVSIDVQYSWKVDGFEEPFVTEVSNLTITFKSAGEKKITVKSIIADDDYITNEYAFTVKVQ